MLLTFAIRVLEILFVLGVAGSAIVVVMTSIEDVRVLFTPDEKTIPANKN
jgi:hypothetical protein